MSRKYGKPDSNHPEIVQTLKALGATVCDLKAVGGGVPDILVGYHGKNILMELKDGNKTPSAAKLNTLQVLWHKQWGGQVDVVKSVDEAIALLNREVRKGT